MTKLVRVCSRAVSVDDRALCLGFFVVDTNAFQGCTISRKQKKEEFEHKNDWLANTLIQVQTSRKRVPEKTWPIQVLGSHWWIFGWGQTFDCTKWYVHCQIYAKTTCEMISFYGCVSVFMQSMLPHVKRQFKPSKKFPYAFNEYYLKFFKYEQHL